MEDLVNVISLSSSEDESNSQITKLNVHFTNEFKTKFDSIFKNHEYMSHKFPHLLFAELLHDIKLFMHSVQYPLAAKNCFWRNFLDKMYKPGLVSQYPIHKDIKYNRVLGAIMAEYLNFRCETLKQEIEKHSDAEIARKQLHEQVNDLCQKINSSLLHIFNGNRDFVTFALLQVKSDKHYQILLSKLFSKILSCYNNVMDHITYVRLILCFRRWKTLVSHATVKKAINECSRNVLPCNMTGRGIANTRDFLHILPKHKMDKENATNFLINHKLLEGDLLDKAINRYFDAHEAYALNPYKIKKQPRLFKTSRSTLTEHNLKIFTSSIAAARLTSVNHETKTIIDLSSDDEVICLSPINNYKSSISNDNGNSFNRLGLNTATNSKDSSKIVPLKSHNSSSSNNLRKCDNSIILIDDVDVGVVAQPSSFDRPQKIVENNMDTDSEHDAYQTSKIKRRKKKRKNCAKFRQNLTRYDCSDSNSSAQDNNDGKGVRVKLKSQGLQNLSQVSSTTNIDSTVRNPSEIGDRIVKNNSNLATYTNSRESTQSPHISTSNFNDNPLSPIPLPTSSGIVEVASPSSSTTLVDDVSCGHKTDDKITESTNTNPLYSDISDTDIDLNVALRYPSDMFPSKDFASKQHVSPCESKIVQLPDSEVSGVNTNNSKPNSENEIISISQVSPPPMDGDFISKSLNCVSPNPPVGIEEPEKSIIAIEQHVDIVHVETPKIQSELDSVSQNEQNVNNIDNGASNEDSCCATPVENDNKFDSTETTEMVEEVELSTIQVTNDLELESSVQDDTDKNQSIIDEIKEKENEKCAPDISPISKEEVMVYSRIQNNHSIENIEQIDADLLREIDKSIEEESIVAPYIKNTNSDRDKAAKFPTIESLNEPLGCSVHDELENITINKTNSFPEGKVVNKNVALEQDRLSTSTAETNIDSVENNKDGVCEQAVLNSVPKSDAISPSNGDSMSPIEPLGIKASIDSKNKFALEVLHEIELETSEVTHDSVESSITDDVELVEENYSGSIPGKEVLSEDVPSKQEVVTTGYSKDHKISSNLVQQIKEDEVSKNAEQGTTKKKHKDRKLNKRIPNNCRIPAITENDHESVQNTKTNHRLSGNKLQMGSDIVESKNVTEVKNKNKFKDTKISDGFKKVELSTKAFAPDLDKCHSISENNSKLDESQITQYANEEESLNNTLSSGSKLDSLELKIDQVQELSITRDGKILENETTANGTLPTTLVIRPVKCQERHDITIETDKSNHIAFKTTEPISNLNEVTELSNIKYTYCKPDSLSIKSINLVLGKKFENISDEEGINVSPTNTRSSIENEPLQIIVSPEIMEKPKTDFMTYLSLTPTSVPPVEEKPNKGRRTKPKCVRKLDTSKPVNDLINLELLATTAEVLSDKPEIIETPKLSKRKQQIELKKSIKTKLKNGKNSKNRVGKCTRNTRSSAKEASKSVDTNCEPSAAPKSILKARRPSCSTNFNMYDGIWQQDRTSEILKTSMDLIKIDVSSKTPMIKSTPSSANISSDSDSDRLVIAESKVKFDKNVKTITYDGEFITDLNDVNEASSHESDTPPASTINRRKRLTKTRDGNKSHDSDSEEDNVAIGIEDKPLKKPKTNQEYIFNWAFEIDLLNRFENNFPPTEEFNNINLASILNAVPISAMLNSASLLTMFNIRFIAIHRCVKSLDLKQVVNPYALQGVIDKLNIIEQKDYVYDLPILEKYLRNLDNCLKKVKKFNRKNVKIATLNEFLKSWDNRIKVLRNRLKQKGNTKEKVQQWQKLIQNDTEVKRNVLNLGKNVLNQKIDFDQDFVKMEQCYKSPKKIFEDTIKHFVIPESSNSSIISSSTSEPNSNADTVKSSIEPKTNWQSFSNQKHKRDRLNETAKLNSVSVNNYGKLVESIEAESKTHTSSKPNHKRDRLNEVANPSTALKRNVAAENVELIELKNKCQSLSKHQHKHDHFTKSNGATEIKSLANNLKTNELKNNFQSSFKHNHIKAHSTSKIIIGTDNVESIESKNKLKSSSNHNNKQDRIDEMTKPNGTFNLNSGTGIVESIEFKNKMQMTFKHKRERLDEITKSLKNRNCKNNSLSKNTHNQVFLILSQENVVENLTSTSPVVNKINNGIFSESFNSKFEARSLLQKRLSLFNESKSSIIDAMNKFGCDKQISDNAINLSNKTKGNEPSEKETPVETTKVSIGLSLTKDTELQKSLISILKNDVQPAGKSQLNNEPAEKKKPSLRDPGEPTNESGVLPSTKDVELQNIEISVSINDVQPAGESQLDNEPNTSLNSPNNSSNKFTIENLAEVTKVSRGSVETDKDEVAVIEDLKEIDKINTSSNPADVELKSNITVQEIVFVSKEIVKVHGNQIDEQKDKPIDEEYQPTKNGKSARKIRKSGDKSSKMVQSIKMTKRHNDKLARKIKKIGGKLNKLANINKSGSTQKDVQMENKMGLKKLFEKLSPALSDREQSNDHIGIENKADGTETEHDIVESKSSDLSAEIAQSSCQKTTLHTCDNATATPSTEIQSNIVRDIPSDIIDDDVAPTNDDNTESTTSKNDDSVDQINGKEMVQPEKLKQSSDGGTDESNISDGEPSFEKTNDNVSEADSLEKMNVSIENSDYSEPVDEIDESIVESTCKNHLSEQNDKSVNDVDEINQLGHDVVVDKTENVTEKLDEIQSDSINALNESEEQCDPSLEESCESLNQGSLENPNESLEESLKADIGQINESVVGENNESDKIEQQSEAEDEAVEINESLEEVVQIDESIEEVDDSFEQIQGKVENSEDEVIETTQNDKTVESNKNISESINKTDEFNDNDKDAFANKINKELVRPNHNLIEHDLIDKSNNQNGDTDNQPEVQSLDESIVDTSGTVNVDENKLCQKTEEAEEICVKKSFNTTTASPDRKLTKLIDSTIIEKEPKENDRIDCEIETELISDFDEMDHGEENVTEKSTEKDNRIILNHSHETIKSIVTPLSGPDKSYVELHDARSEDSNSQRLDPKITAAKVDESKKARCCEIKPNCKILAVDNNESNNSVDESDDAIDHDSEIQERSNEPKELIDTPKAINVDKLNATEKQNGTLKKLPRQENSCTPHKPIKLVNKLLELPTNSSALKCKNENTLDSYNSASECSVDYVEEYTKVETLTEHNKSKPPSITEEEDELIQREDQRIKAVQEIHSELVKIISNKSEELLDENSEEVLPLPSLKRHCSSSLEPDYKCKIPKIEIDKSPKTAPDFTTEFIMNENSFSDNSCHSSKSGIDFPEYLVNTNNATNTNQPSFSIPLITSSATVSTDNGVQAEVGNSDKLDIVESLISKNLSNNNQIDDDLDLDGLRDFFCLYDEFDNHNVLDRSNTSLNWENEFPNSLNMALDDLNMDGENCGDKNGNVKKEKDCMISGNDDNRINMTPWDNIVYPLSYSVESTQQTCVNMDCILENKNKMTPTRLPTEPEVENPEPSSYMLVDIFANKTFEEVIYNQDQSKSTLVDQTIKELSKQLPSGDATTTPIATPPGETTTSHNDVDLVVYDPHGVTELNVESPSPSNPKNYQQTELITINHDDIKENDSKSENFELINVFLSRRKTRKISDEPIEILSDSSDRSPDRSPQKTKSPTQHSPIHQVDVLPEENLSLAQATSPLQSEETTPLQNERSPLQNDMSPLSNDVSPIQNEASPRDSPLLQNETSPLHKMPSPIQKETTPIKQKNSPTVPLPQELSPTSQTLPSFEQDQVSTSQLNISPKKDDEKLNENVIIVKKKTSVSKPKSPEKSKVENIEIPVQQKSTPIPLWKHTPSSKLKRTPSFTEVTPPTTPNSLTPHKPELNLDYPKLSLIPVSSEKSRSCSYQRNPLDMPTLDFEDDCNNQITKFIIPIKSQIVQPPPPLPPPLVKIQPPPPPPPPPHTPAVTQSQSGSFTPSKPYIIKVRPVIETKDEMTSFLNENVKLKRPTDNSNAYVNSSSSSKKPKLDTFDLIKNMPVEKISLPHTSSNNSGSIKTDPSSRRVSSSEMRTSVSSSSSLINSPLNSSNISSRSMSPSTGASTKHNTSRHHASYSSSSSLVKDREYKLTSSNNQNSSRFSNPYPYTIKPLSHSSSSKYVPITASIDQSLRNGRSKNRLPEMKLSSTMPKFNLVPRSGHEHSYSSSLSPSSSSSLTSSGSISSKSRLPVTVPVKMNQSRSSTSSNHYRNTPKIKYATAVDIFSKYEEFESNKNKNDVHVIPSWDPNECSIDQIIADLNKEASQRKNNSSQLFNRE